MFQLAHPEFLFLLFILPLVALWLGKKGKSAAIQYSSGEIVRRLGASRRTQAGRWLTLLRLLGLALLIIALARPQQGESTTEIEASGIDMMLAVDISGSMDARDFLIGSKSVSRLEVVKNVMMDFITDRPNDRIGIVAFAGYPYLVSPTTLDHDWLLQNLDRVQIGLKQDGTAIGSGLAASINRLQEEQAKSKVVILLTDGVNNAGKIAPLTAAEAARALGVKVYTIAAGARGSAPMPFVDQFGRRQMMMVPVDVDEDTLKQIAEMTGGKFYRATDTKSLQRIYDEIDQLEKTKATLYKYENFHDLFAWALWPALLLFATELGLAQTRWRRLP